MACMSPKAKVQVAREHWKRTQAAQRLHDEGVLSNDLSGLHRRLNEARKGVFYEGEEPDLAGLSIEDVLADIENAVAKAEADTS